MGHWLTHCQQVDGTDFLLLPLRGDGLRPPFCNTGLILAVPTTLRFEAVGPAGAVLPGLKSCRLLNLLIISLPLQLDDPAGH